MDERCDYLLPDCSQYVGGSAYPAEKPQCLLREGHDGAHLVRFSDDRTILWEKEMGECDCTPQEQEDGECECFYYRDITSDEAEALIRKEGPS